MSGIPWNKEQVEAHARQPVRESINPSRHGQAGAVDGKETSSAHPRCLGWVLGAPDPEMERIEQILRDVGEEVVHALADNGRRVQPHTAYGFPRTSGTSAVPNYFVECEPRSGYPEQAVVIDHHGDRCGNVVAMAPAGHPMIASALGQVIQLLAQRDLLPLTWTRMPSPIDLDLDQRTERLLFRDRRWLASLGPDAAICAVVPQDLVLSAAADHSLAQAYRGELDGVDPEALGHWRATSRAGFQKRTVEEVLSDIARAKEVILAAPELLIANHPVRDLRHCDLPESPEASAQLGATILYGPFIQRDRRRKYGVLGAPPAVVRAWLAGSAPVPELVNLYGDPGRGYAGGYQLPV
jgi:hypothetical protein